MMTSQAQPKPNKPAITLYLDTVSPFAYEAYYILRHDAAFEDCQVTFVPIFLGGLMHKVTSFSSSLIQTCRVVLIH